MTSTPSADDAWRTGWGRHRRSLGGQPQRSLVAWMAGLPWVEEVGGRSPPRPVRRFDVRCPPLGVHAQWAVVTAEHGRPELAVQLVVPPLLCEVAEGAGWFDEVTPLRDGSYLCGVSLDNRQPAEVQVVVLSVYGFMFPSPWPPAAE